MKHCRKSQLSTPTQPLSPNVWQTFVQIIVCQTFLVKHLTTQQRCRYLPDVYYRRLSIVYFNKCLSDVYFISFLEHFLCVWQRFIFILPAQPQDLPCPRSGAGSYIASVSFFFFFFFLLLLLSSICQHANISDTLGPIMLILRQSNKSADAHFWHNQFGAKGHDGVAGVKKVIFTKIAISSTNHMVWSCDSCILIS